LKEVKKRGSRSGPSTVLSYESPNAHAHPVKGYSPVNLTTPNNLVINRNGLNLAALYKVIAIDNIPNPDTTGIDFVLELAKGHNVHLTSNTIHTTERSLHLLYLREKVNELELTWY
jgi:hypothetical protein